MLHLPIYPCQVRCQDLRRMKAYVWLENIEADHYRDHSVSEKTNKFFVKNNFQNHLKGQKQKWVAVSQEPRSRSWNNYFCYQYPKAGSSMLAVLSKSEFPNRSKTFDCGQLLHINHRIHYENSRANITYRYSRSLANAAHSTSLSCHKPSWSPPVQWRLLGWCFSSPSFSYLIISILHQLILSSVLFMCFTTQ